MRNAQVTTTGMTPNIFPVVPGMKYMGRKATMLVRILKVTGMATSRVQPATGARPAIGDAGPNGTMPLGLSALIE